MLTAKTSARYGLRVFGYLLATTLAAGIVVGIGAGGAYALESAFFEELPPGGPAADWTALSVFGAGLGVGLLVFAAGLFVTLADAVSAGMRAAETTNTETAAAGTEGAADTAATEESPEEKSAPEASEPGETEPVADETPPVADEGEPIANEEPTGDGDVFGEPDPEPSETAPSDREETGSMGTDPFAEAAESDSYDPTDPIDDPHEAQSNPFDEPEEQPTADEWTSKTPQGEPGGDDAEWREEIEAKLDEDEE